MPLIHGKSKEARNENISRELEANPEMDPKQAAAIAYRVQREAQQAKDGADACAQALDALRTIADKFK